MLTGWRCAVSDQADDLCRCIQRTLNFVIEEHPFRFEDNRSPLIQIEWSIKLQGKHKGQQGLGLYNMCY